MSRRTDSYPIVDANPAVMQRMAHADQVHPGAALDVLLRGGLVFALAPDKTWRRVQRIGVSSSAYSDASIYHIVFAASPTLRPHYQRTFSSSGILLVEAPTTDLTGD